MNPKLTLSESIRQKARRAESADAVAVAEVMALLAGIGTVNGDARAVGYLTGNITPFTDLSPQGLARAVWDEALVEHEDDATFGGLMQRLLTVARYLGLR
jgi:hypothetical protein